MGNRALIVFTDKQIVSPIVYLHWHGNQATEWIRKTEDLMAGRTGDVSYATARFIGIAHEHIDGNLSLGVWSAPEGAEDFTLEDWRKVSHGDSGVFVVDVADFSYDHIGGYE